MSRLRLRYVAGSRGGQEAIFFPPRVRIGRSRDNDLVLSESEWPLASAHHAEARFEDGHWWIVDLGSTNHTFLNGRQIERARLGTGDRVAFADAALGIRIDAGLARWISGIAVLVAGAVIVSLLALRTGNSSFEEVAANAPQSVYLVAVDADGRRVITGTAFAVDGARRLLATNAHVADALRRPTHAGGSARPRAIAVRSDAEDVERIASVRLHPRWRPGSLEYDVALLQLDGQPRMKALPLADDEIVRQLRRGAPVASFGFPAVSTDAMRPRGRLAVDVVGDVRLPYLEVGLSISPGTSGSPIFDRSGTVVAVVAGGDFVDARDGRGNQPSGSAVNWAIVSTAVRDLLEQTQ